MKMTPSRLAAASAEPAHAQTLAAPHPSPRSEGTRSLRLLLAWAALLPAAALAWSAWIAWDRAWAEARLEVVRGAAIGAEYAARVLNEHAGATQRLVDLLGSLSDAEIRLREAELHASLRARVASSPELQTAWVLDREARPLLSATVLPVPRNIDLSDREHHMLLTAPGAPEVAVTRVYRGRVENNVFFAVARRRESGPDGAYAGQVNVSVDPGRVAEALQRILGRPGDAIGLVRADGEVLARSHHGPPAEHARIPAGSPVVQRMARGDVAWDAVTPSALDGVVRIGAVRRVEGWPVYVTAARPREAVVEAWRRSMMPPLAAAIPAAAVLLGLSVLVGRKQRRLGATNAELEARVAERAVALAGAKARLERIQEIGRVGGFEIDLPTGANLRSAGYMRLHGAPAEEAVEAHRDWVARLHPEDRDRAERAFLQAVSDGGPTDYAQEYRVATPTGEVRWIAARAEIQRDARGVALRMVGAHLDVTELKEAQRVQAEAVARLSAALRGARLGTWERRLPANETWWDERAVEMLGGLRPEGEASSGIPLTLIHPDDRARHVAAIRAAVEPGGSDSLDTEFRLRLADGRWRWFASHGSVVRRDAETGAALLVAGVVQDVTERREAEAERTRLMREVDHRARNALATAAALVRLTPRGDAAAYAAAVQGRIEALAALHDALAASGWEGAELGALAEACLGEFRRATPGRIALQGPPVLLAPAQAQALCLVLHELATNARRHGALSVRDGKVALSWAAESADAVSVRWEESGGPARGADPVREGFGLRLARQTLRHGIGGALDIHWHDGACIAAIRLPRGMGEG